MAKATSAAAPDATSTANGEPAWKDVPEPVIVDGYWAPAPGEIVQGLVLEYDPAREADRSGTFKIRLGLPARVKQRESDQTKVLPVGKVIGVNETAKLRYFHSQMKNGPITVRIECKGKREDGRGWELDAKVRPAF